jgi:hypothetical protein
MGRPEKGQKTPGSGIKKGTKHKRTMAEEACAKLGINPFELLAQAAMDGSENAIIQLCKHIEPPKRALEVAIDPEKNEMIIRVLDYGSKG